MITTTLHLASAPNNDICKLDLLIIFNTALVCFCCCCSFICFLSQQCLHRQDIKMGHSNFLTFFKIYFYWVKLLGKLPNQKSLSSEKFLELFMINKVFSIFGKFDQKIETFCLRWNLAFRLTRMCRIWFWCLLFHVLDQKHHPFWHIRSKEIKFVCLRLNLAFRLIRICWIRRWYALFLFWTRNSRFRQSWSKNLKLSA